MALENCTDKGIAQFFIRDTNIQGKARTSWRLSLLPFPNILFNCIVELMRLRCLLNNSKVYWCHLNSLRNFCPWIFRHIIGPRINRFASKARVFYFDNLTLTTHQYPGESRIGYTNHIRVLNVEFLFKKRSSKFSRWWDKQQSSSL